MAGFFIRLGPGQAEPQLGSVEIAIGAPTTWFHLLECGNKEQDKRVVNR